jgi:EmrB/QacA subfamily drug resistance transporter
MQKEQNLEYPVHKIIVPWVVACALFMETLDATILSGAIPVISTSLDQNPLNLKVALTSYLVSLGILIPISGWLSDKYGTKEILFWGVSIFCIGSFMCGISFELYQLVISRIIQGAGGALMMPVCRLILIKSYPKSELISITNYATIPSLLGPAIGPVLGGIIVTYFSWRWIFFVNIPFCFILLYLVSYHTKSFKNVNIKKFDFIGFFYLTSSLSICIFTMESLSEKFLNYLQGLCLILLSVLLFIFYQISAKKVENPLIDKKLFEFKTFKITLLGSFLSRLGIGGVPFLLPILLQINHDFAPIKSGLLMISYAIAMILAKFCTKNILSQMGFKNTLIFNTLLLGISLGGLIFIINCTNQFLIILLIFLHGFFTSIQFSCLNVLTYIDLGDDLISKGTSIGSAIQQLSMSFGVAFTVVLLRIDGGESNLVGYKSYDLTIFTLSSLLLFTCFTFILLEKDAGSMASGYKLIGKNYETKSKNI